MEIDENTMLNGSILNEPISININTGEFFIKVLKLLGKIVKTINNTIHVIKNIALFLINTARHIQILTKLDSIKVMRKIKPISPIKSLKKTNFLKEFIKIPAIIVPHSRKTVSKNADNTITRNFDI
ncbi:MAG: hypothetical protein LKE46_04015 [Clostridium sp.]|nr:hypothetical protein [Clostridium sp.]MCH3963415.1 hypothetical protein [Clostridium sp.]MCI1716717.1 hypothetical protein [Clostridium sp.]MCI1801099.1 hypothetical protein [Clostridium sp.]MCI1814903.1 hypothetical protein [Clostridium sp.]MCI1871804.1 hypothetical protein [Clostridium sp.]